MTEKQRVLIAGNFKFPRGTASSSRIKLFAKALRHSGVKVLVVTNSALHYKKNERKINNLCFFERIPFISLNQRYNDPTQRLLPHKIIDYFYATLKLWWVIFRMVHNNKVCTIFLYGRSFISFAPVVLFCKLYKVRLVYDAVEWFPASSFRGGYLNPAFWDSHLGSLLPFFGFGGVSCITENIASKYRGKIPETYVIPSLFDFKSVGSLKSNGLDTKQHDIQTSRKQFFIITYAGTLKEGEDFETLLRAVQILLDKGCVLKLNVLGISSKHARVKRYLPLIKQNSSLADSVTFLGRVADEDYFNFLKKSNCLALPRVDTPTTRAAFPTRLPEFLCLSLPVVTSDIPDVNLYLENGIDAELVEPGDPYDLFSAFYRLYKDPVYANKIAKNGYQKALLSFDYHSYALIVRKLMIGM